jgi:HPt (histidine-containing phosphotransfer) domain-containing protein
MYSAHAEGFLKAVGRKPSEPTEPCTRAQKPIAMNTLEALETMLAIAQDEGIEVRNEWLSGVRGGLVRLGSKAVLFVDQALSVPEQLEQVRGALGALDWSETPRGEQMAICLSEPQAQR